MNPFLNSSFLVSNTVRTDRQNPQNKFFLESSVIECEGGPETKRFENCCSGSPWGKHVKKATPELLVLRPPGAPTHAQMSLNFKCPPTLSDWAFLQNGVLVYVWGERDRGGGQGWHPHGGVQDSSDCGIESAAVAVASEEHTLLAWAQALPAPTGSGLP